MRIGVLALQGAFIEHSQRFGLLGADCFEIRQTRDLMLPMDGIVLPGGESTVMCKLLHELGLFSPLLSMINDNLPVFGTCAGLLLLAKCVSNDDTRGFAVMDIIARRNAYGRQLSSFYTEAEFFGLGKIPMTFIRAPYIEAVAGGAKALAVVDGKIVAARQGNMLVTAFHPELSGEASVHRYFLDIADGKA